jgi:hypothetical protein
MKRFWFLFLLLGTLFGQRTIPANVEILGYLEVLNTYTHVDSIEARVFTIGGVPISVVGEETVEDWVGGMLIGVETLISVSYDDPNGEIDFIVDDDLSLYDNTTSGFITTTLTNEQVYDLIGGMLNDGTGTYTGISFTHVDATDDFDIIVDHDAASNFVSQEHLRWDLSGAGTIHTDNYLENATHTGDVTGAGALTIQADKILEGMLKAVDTAVDEDFLTYEFTTGDFEWHSIADLDLATQTWHNSNDDDLPDADEIVESMLKEVDGTPADEDILTYETTTGDFQWHTPSELITAGDALTWAVSTLNFDGGATPSGELGGTWVSPTLAHDALDDQYYDSEADLTGLLDDNYHALTTVGIADDNLLEVDQITTGLGVAEYIRATANGLESRSEAEFKADYNLEIGTDVLAQQTIGIANNNLLEVDGTPLDTEAAVFTASGINGLSEAEFKTAFNMEADTDYESPITDEASLYGKISDVTEFAETDEAESWSLLQTFNANIDIKNGVSAAYWKLYEPSGSGSNSTEFRSAAFALDYVWIFPDEVGTAGQVLEIASVASQTITLEWDDDSGGGGSGTVTTIKEDDLGVGDADIVVIDFGLGFDVAETPDTEVQVTFDPSEIAGHDLFTDYLSTEHYLQSAITEVGTIATGTWQGSIIDHERGGIEISLAAVAIGDMIAGTATGTFGLITSLGHSDGDVWTRQADGSADWETAAGGGNVSNVATPLDNQVAIWTGTTTIEGDIDLTFDGDTLFADHLIVTDGTIGLDGGADEDLIALTAGVVTVDGTLAATIITEGGNAVYNSGQDWTLSKTNPTFTITSTSGNAYFNIDGFASDASIELNVATSGAGDYEYIAWQDEGATEMYMRYEPQINYWILWDQLNNTLISSYDTDTQDYIVSQRLLINELLAMTPSSDQTLTAVGNSIAISRSYARVQGDAPYTLTSTPTVVNPTKDGTVLTIQGLSDVNTITIQDESNLTGSDLSLANATDFTLGLNDFIVLRWDLGDDQWHEIVRNPPLAGGGNVSNSGTPVALDIARWVDATTIEGRSYAEFKADLDLEIGTDILAQQSIGVTDNFLLEVDDVAGLTLNDYTKATASGLVGVDYAGVLADLSGSAGAGFDWNNQTNTGMNSLTFSIGTDVNEFSVDDAMSGNSDNAVPTEATVIAYIANTSEPILTDEASLYTTLSDVTEFAETDENEIFTGTSLTLQNAATSSFTIDSDASSQLFLDSGGAAAELSSLFFAELGVNSFRVEYQGNPNIFRHYDDVLNANVYAYDLDVPGTLGIWGSGAVGVDYIFATVDGQDSDGTITWMEDETRWDLSGSLEVATAITEGGNAIYNSSETPGGTDISGTWASVTIVDDSHAHVYTNIDPFTEANLYTRLSDVSQFYESGDDIAQGDFSNLRLTKSITVESPAADEDITWFFTNVAITITEMRAVLNDGTATPTVTWSVRHHASDRSNAGNEVVTGGTTTTSVTTGSDVTAFNDATIPADSFVWLTTTAQGGTVPELHVTMGYTED